MRFLNLLLLLGLLQVPSDGKGSRTIPLQNPSFENISFAYPGGPEPCGLANRYVIPGWQFQGGGVLQPSATPTQCWLVSPPDGANVAFIASGGSFSQDTGIKPSDIQSVARDGIYTMRFWVGSYFGVYPAYYHADISFVGAAGSQELCETEGWAKWHFSEVPLPCPAPGYLVYDKSLTINGQPAADPNAHIVITFSCSYWIALFDNISLTFTPTPN